MKVISIFSYFSRNNKDEKTVQNAEDCESDSMLMQHRSEYTVTGNLAQIICYTQDCSVHQTEEPQVKTMQTPAPNERIPWVSPSSETLTAMETDQLPYPPCKHTTERIQMEKSKCCMTPF